jgi:hypothetical protein
MRGGRVAYQDIHHDRLRKPPRLRDVLGPDGRIFSGSQFQRSCGMSGRSQDVLDLSRCRQRVEERRAGRSQRRARSFARRSLTCIAGLLSCPVRRPGAVT